MSASVAAAAVVGAAASRAGAQTDYYNTDRGRPVQVEDAYAAERHAFELKLAPARLEWAAGEGNASWEIEPEIAYGLLPRTHVDIGVPVAFTTTASGARRNGVAGLELSLMHNLNAETRTVPALGLRADVLAPVGPLAPKRTYTTFTGMLTRTFRPLRVHVNAQVTAGAAPRLPTSVPSLTSEESSSGAERLSRWLAGVAVDKTFPLHSVLLTAELLARQPLARAEKDTELVAGAGLRLQASPTIALDLGLGRRLDASRGPWYATFGTAYSFGLRALMSGDAE
jgi:hypothetical protein